MDPKSIQCMTSNQIIGSFCLTPEREAHLGVKVYKEYQESHLPLEGGSGSARPTRDQGFLAVL